MTDWKDHGACRGRDPNLFVPPYDIVGWSPEPGKRVCAGCPVRAVCLEEGLARHEVGVWGGMSEREREKFRRSRRRAQRRGRGDDVSVTQEDVAYESGMSQGVVSEVMRGRTSHASPQSVRRVHEAAQRLGYRET